MNGWFDSPIESFKASYNDALAKWQAALTDLDLAYEEFKSNFEFVQDDPEMAERYEQLNSKVQFLESTIGNVSGAISKVQSFLKTVAGAVGMSGKPSLQGLGLLPAVPWALVGLVTAGIAGVYAVVNALRVFNVDTTNKRIAIANIELAGQGKPTLPYMENGANGGLFAGLSDTAKWLTYGVMAYIAYELIKDNRRGNA